MSIWDGFATAFQSGWDMMDSFLEERDKKRADGESIAGYEDAGRQAIEDAPGRRADSTPPVTGADEAAPASETTRTASEATRTPEEELGAPTARPQRSNSILRDGIIAAADELGIDPVVLATAISYETSGTFDPTKRGTTTQWGQHRGLIQFGEPQAREHGVNWDDPLNSQLGRNGAIVSYLRNAGVEPGMGLLDVYSAINAGAPGLYNRTDANNGGAPGTVRDKVEQQMGPHRAKALQLIGDYSPQGSTSRPRAVDTGEDTEPLDLSSLGGGVPEPVDLGDPIYADASSMLASAVPTQMLSQGGTAGRTSAVQNWQQGAPDGRGSVFLRYNMANQQGGAGQGAGQGTQARQAVSVGTQGGPSLTQRYLQNMRSNISGGGGTSERFRQLRDTRQARMEQERADARAAQEAELARQRELMGGINENFDSLYWQRQMGERVRGDYYDRDIMSQYNRNMRQWQQNDSSAATQPEDYSSMASNRAWANLRNSERVFKGLRMDPTGQFLAKPPELDVLGRPIDAEAARRYRELPLAKPELFESAFGRGWNTRLDRRLYG